MNGATNYEETFGLWLNRHYAMRRRAATVALGVSALVSVEAARALQDAAG